MDGAERGRGRRVAAAMFLVMASFGWWLSRTQEAAAPPVAPAPGPVRVAASETRHHSAGADDTPAPVAKEATDEREEPAKRREVRIVVVAAESGAPVEGAEVRIHVIDQFEDVLVRSIDAKTDAAGVAAVSLDAQLSSHLLVRKRGFCVVRQHIEHKSAEIRVPLAAGVPLAGRVVLADTREPVAGAAVRVWDSGHLQGWNDGGELDGTLVTGDDGRFELAGLPPSREVTVVAAKSGYRSQIVKKTLNGPEPEIEVLLGDGGVMFGVVYGEDGRPLGGVEVLQTPADRAELPDRANPGVPETYAQRAFATFLFPPVVTGPDGRYEFRGVRLPVEGVPQPRVAVARRADGHTARGEPATFTQQGERQQRDVRFAAAPSLTVRVKSATPLPAGSKVRAQRNGGRPDESKPLPAGGEAVEFTGLAPGDYFVSVSSGEFPQDEWQSMRQIALAAGECPVVEFVLDDAVRISGRVIDEKGEGIAWMQVEVTTAAAGQTSYATAQVRSGKDGSFAFQRLLPLPARIRAGPSDFDSMRGFAGSDEPPASKFETVELADVAPGGTPLLITLRRLGRFSGRFDPIPSTERSLSLRALAGAKQGHASLIVGADGAFTCDAPLVGVPMVVWIESEDAAPAVFDVSPVAPGESRDLGTIALTLGRVIEGRVVDAKGVPVATVEVRTLDRWAHFQSPTTDADGRFRLERLGDRPLVLRVEATHATALAIVRIEDTKVSPATFKVGPGAIVRGQVLDAAGAAVAGAQVVFRPGLDLTDSEDAFGWTKADADGRYALRLQSGRGLVRAYQPGDSAKLVESELTLADGETRSLDLRLP